jgi:methyl-accepting chemotaxis protein
VDDLIKSFNALSLEQDKTIALGLSGNVQEAKSTLQSLRVMADSVDKKMGELVDLKVSLMDKDMAAAREAYSEMRGLVLGVIFAALLLSIIFGAFLTRAIARPLAQMVDAANKISVGDLDQSIAYESKDEVGMLAKAFRQMKSNLEKMVGEIRHSCITIGSGASQIAQGNGDLSQRTQEQASALEETASSIEEMSSTVKQNADSAKQANQLAATARAQAEKGGDVASKAVAAMLEINTCSKRISDIISVIDGIAFQTNLLALNAAVEAARAGEQGRGFAVVAAEVRKLSQRSADAAKEISKLIKDSVGKVEDGTRLVDASGKALEEIIQAVKKVSDIIAEIAAASQEQSSGIDQINKAVSQMDEVTQQNASLVEEAASASESMDAQARVLLKQMEFFKIGDSGVNNQEIAAALVKSYPALEFNPAKAAPERSARIHKTSLSARPAGLIQHSTIKPNGKDGEWASF